MCHDWILANWLSHTIHTTHHADTHTHAHHAIRAGIIASRIDTFGDLSLRISSTNATLHEEASVELFGNKLGRSFVPVESHWLYVNDGETILGTPMSFFFYGFVYLIGKVGLATLNIIDRLTALGEVRKSD